MSTMKDFTLSCPLPISDYPTVTLAHGGGGKLMHQLIEKMILPAFNSPLLETRHDGAVFELGGARLAFTTDSYVVQSAVFSRRRHRLAGDQRHGQRSVDVRRAPGLPELRPHSGRGARRWRRCGRWCRA